MSISKPSPVREKQPDPEFVRIRYAGPASHARSYEVHRPLPHRRATSSRSPETNSGIRGANDFARPIRHANAVSCAAEVNVNTNVLLNPPRRFGRNTARSTIGNVSETTCIWREHARSRISWRQRRMRSSCLAGWSLNLVRRVIWQTRKLRLTQGWLI